MIQSAKGNLVVAQSGGPTVVINSSLVGVVHQAMEENAVGDIYGAMHGISGVLNENLIDLGRLSPTVLDGVRRTPSAALGTVRQKLSKADYQRILDVFQTYNIRYFLYIGGNDSMDTTHRVHKLAHEAGYELHVIGVPKTIDNDLAGTDHCPGYGSAARFVAMAVRDSGFDTEAMGASSPVKIVEIMGRNAGWLTAAAVLGKVEEQDPPQLVYVPERPVSPQTLLKDVKTWHERLGHVVIALSEGASDEHGESLGSSLQPAEVDVFGHRMKGGAGDAVARLITSELGLKARVDRPNYLQRSLMIAASNVDLQEAYDVGRSAVKAAAGGQSDKMAALVRISSSPYECTTQTVDLARVANVEKTLPPNFFDPATGQITEEFVSYALPLIGDPLPSYTRLPIHYVNKKE